MKRNVLAITMITAIFIVGGSTAALARGGMGPGFGPADCIDGKGQFQFWFAGLDDQQRAEVTKLIGEHHKARYAAQLNLRAKRAEIVAALAATNVDERTVKALVVEANTLSNRIYADQIDFQMKMIKEYGAPLAIGQLGPRMGFGPHHRGHMGPGMARGMRYGTATPPCPVFGAAADDSPDTPALPGE